MYSEIFQMANVLEQNTESVEDGETRINTAQGVRGQLVPVLDV